VVTLAALALGATLGGGTAQGGGDSKLNVSAIILPRTACSFAGTTFRCSGQVTTFRVRSDASVSTSATATRDARGVLTVTVKTGRGAPTQSGIDLETVALTIEL
jgi:hypothetical protein